LDSPQFPGVLDEIQRKACRCHPVTAGTACGTNSRASAGHRWRPPVVLP
jgi:hypothetical protein